VPLLRANDSSTTAAAAIGGESMAGEMAGVGAAGEFLQNVCV